MRCGLLPPAQNHGVAGLECERKRLDRDVGPRLEDHENHAERRAHARDAQAVLKRFLLNDFAIGIRERAYLPQTLPHLLQARVTQRETIAKRGVGALRKRGQVLRVRGQKFSRAT